MHEDIEVDASAAKPESKKARKRRQLLEKKSLKAKVATLKKTKCASCPLIKSDMQAALSDVALAATCTKHKMEVAFRHKLWLTSDDAAQTTTR